GGGVLFSQAIHQIDVVRYLAGGQGTRLAALTGNWDAARPTEGAYAALLSFAGGVFATLTYSGYAHFDSDTWMGDVAELGQDKTAAYGAARRGLKGIAPGGESAAKMQRTYGRGAEPAPAPHHEHFGPVIALCDRGDLRLTPDGVEINGDLTREFRAAPVGRPRAGVLDALHDAVRLDRAPVQDGAWGLASLEVCHAILRAAETGEWQELTCQTNAE
ncbi:MAG: Gfo/Idh/MocA family oxidoreductase, partial [Pseudomonadota bacterium]|nr:Gfo/Idh/MocA family oxidoreductase [Pseudomonadota bacterium]